MPKAAGLSLATLLGLALLAAAGPLGMDMFLPSLPEITREFETTAPTTQLGITSFMVGMGLGQLIIGPMSDRLGRKKLLIGGAVVGLGASLVCATAPTVGVWIIARGFQGAAGGTGVVLARAMVADRSEGTQAAKAYSLMMTIVGVAPVLAPLIGAAVAGMSGWRGVFWLLVAIAIAQLAVAVWLPESHPEDQRTAGGPATTIRAMGSLLRMPAFVGHAMVFGLGFGAMFAFIAGSSVVLQEQLGLSAAAYSVMFAMNASALILTNVAGARLVNRFRPQALQRAGVILVSSGAAALVVVTFAVPAAPAVVACTFVLTSGTALCMVHSTALAQGLAHGKQGAASALLGAVQFAVGGSVSPAVALGENTLLTMAIVMAVCAAGAVAGRLLVAARG
ncbi:MAG TPA: multidrug effflux MFS transporter [Candidatus Corynebacterium gallistercoris]|uniref:Multidrug effflux MFS transporter n=1 Tax=Candidatus Corynebacterium gallistercoris TaxID=2838530 RepID=A0A9D1RWW1_9CORY|nr:multidrug effflux MFS transporter [Candidatus Corynebacterium gallistercoris]